MPEVMRSGAGAPVVSLRRSALRNRYRRENWALREHVTIALSRVKEVES